MEPDDRECSVCHELYTDPKLLPCGHLLCGRCLVSWLHTQPAARCPLCRWPITERQQPGPQSPEDIAAGFPTDLSMAALVEADRLLHTEHKCRVCEDVAAASLCLHCGDMLCAACTRAHGKLSVSKHHVVAELSSLTAEQLAADRPSPCAAHPEETARLYCPAHGAHFCALCAWSSHKACPGVRDLGEQAEESRAQLAELAARLRAGEADLEAAIGRLDQHLRDAEQRSQAALAEMEATCDRLEAAVKACRQRLRELALGARSDAKESVHAGKTCLLRRRGMLTAHKAVVERAEGTKTREIVNRMASVMQTRATELDFSATLPASVKVVSMETLIIDPQAVSSIERALSELGKVKVVPADVVAHVRMMLFLFVCRCCLLFCCCCR